jgi:hypothetical protein
VFYLGVLVLGAIPIALFISPYLEIFICPDPPITEPYIVIIKIKVDIAISATKILIVSLKPIYI